MQRKRLTVKWLKNHWSYSWWKYAAIVVVCWMGVDLLFTSTAYRPPEEKKLELYVLNDFVKTEQLHDVLWPQLQHRSPDQEELTVLNINLSGNDTYAYMQYSTYLAAQQGDVCLMPRGEVAKLAEEGADHVFVELSDYIANGVIDPKGIDLSRGMLKTKAGEEGLYAIPADSLSDLKNLSNNPSDSFLVLLAHGGNDDHAAVLLDLMIENYHVDSQEDYVPAQESLQNPATIF